MTMVAKDCAKSVDTTKPDLEGEADILRLALKSFTTAEGKLECLIKKYVELAHQNKVLEAKGDSLQKKHDILNEERDSLQASYNRANLAKSKLESLCRELQRYVKCLKEEHEQRAKEEESKRQEIAGKFQTAINDINERIKDDKESNLSLKKDNMELATKLKEVIEQCKAREETVEKIIKQKNLEVQLAETKLVQVVEEKRKAATEKRSVLEMYANEKTKNELLLEQEQELRHQLTLYTDKFEEFQKTLTRSNEVFATFKQEMYKMTVTIKKLEKENLTWKSKHEQSSNTMFTMAEELGLTRTKCEKLEKLCRALQFDNRTLRAQSKDKPGENTLVESDDTKDDNIPPTEPDEISEEKVTKEENEKDEEEPTKTRGESPIQVGDRVESPKTIGEPSSPCETPRTDTQGERECAAAEQESEENYI